LLAYGKWYSRRVEKNGEGESWASGLYGSVYNGPGVAVEEKTIYRKEFEEGRSL
jgi:hypothetical protein